MFYAKKRISDVNWQEEATKPEKQNLYLIVDMVHYDTPTGVGAYYANKNVFFKDSISLFQGTIDEELDDIAPYLCWINSPNCVMKAGDWVFLEKEEREKSSLIWLWSELEPKALHVHLQHFMAGKLRNGREALLRFYDPRVFPKFLTMIKEEQTQLFWKGITQIALWDNETEQRVIYERE